VPSAEHTATFTWQVPEDSHAMEIKYVMTWYIRQTVTDGTKTVKHRLSVHGLFDFNISLLPHFKSLFNNTKHVKDTTLKIFI
jgi:uncharacterized protein YndB with AHSA1/START domain